MLKFPIDRPIAICLQEDGINWMNTGQKRIVIADPSLPQSAALARRLATSENNILIASCHRRPFRIPSQPHFSETVIAEDPLRVPGDMHVIGGSRATKRCLEEYGELQLGEVHFNQANLRFYSKVEGQRLASECGWAIPQTWLTADELPKQINTFFVKPATEGTGGLRAPRKYREAYQLLQSPHYVAQEIIHSGTTLGYAFIAQHGQILAESAHHEIASMPKNGGSAVIIERSLDESFIQRSREFVEAVKYTGWGLLEAKRDVSSKRLVFLELNAKLWASIEFSLRQDPRFAELLINHTETETRVDSLWFVNRTNLNALRMISQRRIAGKRDLPLVEPNVIRSIISKNLPRLKIKTP
ncbi:MAG: hypothetical protein AAF546_00685 [Verrucomicrobiota bacterium]